MTGEIAGTGAALAIEQNRDGSVLSPELLRDELRKQQFKFHFEEVGLDPADHS